MEYVNNKLELLDVYYLNEHVNLGRILTLEDCSMMPTVSLVNLEKEKLYTLAMVNINKGDMHVHWLSINMNYTLKPNKISDYKKPAESAELIFYKFLLYKQTKEIITRIKPPMVLSQILNYDKLELIAVNFFYCKNVDSPKISPQSEVRMKLKEVVNEHEHDKKKDVELNEKEKINFFNNKSFITEDAHRVLLKLDDRIIQNFKYSHSDASNFDFKTLSKDELTNLLAIFQDCLKNFNTSLIKVLANETVYLIIHMKCLSEHIKDKKEVKKDEFLKLVEELLSIFLIKYLKNLETIEKNVKNLNILKDFLKFFDETDLMMEYMFRIYLKFQKNFDLFCDIYNNYQSDFDKDKFMKECKILLERYNILGKYIKNEEILKQLLTFNMNTMNQLIHKNFRYIETVINSLIGFKTQIMDKIIILLAHKKQDSLYQHCSIYFGRFYELEILKNEMVENMSIGFNVKLVLMPEIPSILIKCHKHVMGNKSLMKKIILTKTQKEIIQKNIEKYLKGKLNFYYYLKISKIFFWKKLRFHLKKQWSIT
jgi:hypothetical protein